MAAQLRGKHDVIINGGRSVGFTLLNIIYKSPHLNRSKVLLVEQASKHISYHRQSKIVEQSLDNRRGYSSLGQSDVRFSNGVTTINQASRLPFKRMGVCDIVRPYALSQASYSSDSQNSSGEKIEKLLKNTKKRVFVFMKGVPSEPACGYSNAVVQILNAYGVEYDSFNVLSDEGVRQEVKTYSNWPTIPQVYVDGSFIGGCDILIQMHQNNELESLFKSNDNDDGDKKEK